MDAGHSFTQSRVQGTHESSFPDDARSVSKRARKTRAGSAARVGVGSGEGCPRIPEPGSVGSVAGQGESKERDPQPISASSGSPYLAWATATVRAWPLLCQPRRTSATFYLSASHVPIGCQPAWSRRNPFWSFRFLLAGAADSIPIDFGAWQDLPCASRKSCKV